MINLFSINNDLKRLLTINRVNQYSIISNFNYVYFYEDTMCELLFKTPKFFVCVAKPDHNDQSISSYIILVFTDEKTNECIGAVTFVATDNNIEYIYKLYKYGLSSFLLSNTGYFDKYTFKNLTVQEVYDKFNRLVMSKTKLNS